jgi:hypothetical protein
MNEILGTDDIITVSESASLSSFVTVDAAVRVSNGFGYIKTLSAKQIDTKRKPTAALLKISHLWPPNACFPMTIEKTAATITILYGTDAGIINARTRPVIIDEISLMLYFDFRITMHIKSVSQQTATDIKITINALIP